MNYKLIWLLLLVAFAESSSLYKIIHSGPFRTNKGQVIAELNASHFDLSNHEIREILLMRFAHLSYEQKIILLKVINNPPAGRTPCDILKEQLGGSIYLCRIGDEQHYIDNRFCKGTNLFETFPKRIRTLFKQIQFFF